MKYSLLQYGQELQAWPYMLSHLIDIIQGALKKLMLQSHESRSGCAPDEEDSLVQRRKKQKGSYHVIHTFAGNWSSCGGLGMRTPLLKSSNVVASEHWTTVADNPKMLAAIYCGHLS